MHALNRGGTGGSALPLVSDGRQSSGGALEVGLGEFDRGGGGGSRSVGGMGGGGGGNPLGSAGGHALGEGDAGHGGGRPRRNALRDAQEYYEAALQIDPGKSELFTTRGKSEVYYSCVACTSLVQNPTLVRG